MPQMVLIHLKYKFNKHFLIFCIFKNKQGQYPSAIETLQTAISLIKQSKISQDERCKLLISSLQDTKKGIEDRYYSNSNSMLVPNGTNQAGLILNNNRANSSGSRGESRDRERYKKKINTLLIQLTYNCS